jgi:hypothetical protein
MTIITLDQLLHSCKVDLGDNFKESIYVATKVLIGYSLYVDIAIMNVKGGLVQKYVHASGWKHHLFVTFIIISFVTVVKVVELMFRNDIDKCKSS